MKDLIERAMNYDSMEYDDRDEAYKNLLRIKDELTDELVKEVNRSIDIASELHGKDLRIAELDAKYIALLDSVSKHVDRADKAEAKVERLKGDGASVEVSIRTKDLPRKKAYCDFRGATP